MRGRTIRSRYLSFAALAALAALTAVTPAAAQLIAEANAFPTGIENDGKFVALAGTEFATLSQGNLSFSIQVPLTDPGSNHSCVSGDLTGNCVFIGIFDGDTTGENFFEGPVCSQSLDSCMTDADCGATGGTCGPSPDEKTKSIFNRPDGQKFQHWDNLAINNFTGAEGVQLGIALFRDPNQVASTAPEDFIGYWLGDGTANETSGPDWVTFGGGNFNDLDVGDPLPDSGLAMFPDNSWWNLELEVNDCTPGSPNCAQAETRVQSFHLCLFFNPDTRTDFDPYDTDPEEAAKDIAKLCRPSDLRIPDGTLPGEQDQRDTVSVFKVQAEAEIALLSDSFAFEGGLHNLADFSALLQDWPNQLFVPGAPTTYDGKWEFSVVVPTDRLVRELVLFDGDFDYGTRPPLDTNPEPEFPGNIGFPSGFEYAECFDDDDLDSPGHPEFVFPLVDGGSGVELCRTDDPGETDPNVNDWARPPLGCVLNGTCEDACGIDGSVLQNGWSPTRRTAGSPADNNIPDTLRRFTDDSAGFGPPNPNPLGWPGGRSNCVVYQVTSPTGDVFRNPNPSGQREWEQFRIVSRCEIGDADPDIRECGCYLADPPPGAVLCPATLPNGSPFPPELGEVYNPILDPDPTMNDDLQADYVVNDPALPPGLWKVEIFGVDLSNLNAWRGPRFCAAGPCVIDSPYKVGDTVWKDANGDAVQDDNGMEPGIPDVKVNLIGELGAVITAKNTGEEGADLSFACEACNTGGDPAGPADPAIPDPVDETGLYCFDVTVPPPPRLCSQSSQPCRSDNDCPADETCEPSPRDVCSESISQSCIEDSDCPAGETCLRIYCQPGVDPPDETCFRNCRDFVVEVDSSNFLPGGPLDGFGPTTQSPQKDCQICEANGGAVRLNCDFGYAPCNECDGKVSRLTLEYQGTVPALIRVDQKNGDTVFGPAMRNPGEEVTLGAGTDKGTYGTEIKIYVDGAFHVQIHTSCSQPIFPGLVKGDFRVVRGASRNGGAFCPAECQPTQVEDLEIQDDELKWRIKNSGNTPITVSRVLLEWPPQKGNLKKIELDGTFYEQLVPPPALDVSSGFEADVGKRTLDPGQDKDLKFRFDDKFDAGQYFVRVEFGDASCSLETSGAACITDCEKPIHDLSMIWNGSQTVSVTAWKGSVGSTSLGTQTATPGQRVTFGDFAGSPNDVVWEIFDLVSGQKLGESKFHLSCSDDAMNGAEDCGKPQGDGKGNDSGLVNDWLFDGWRDKDETLTCSPEPICEPSDPPPGDPCLTDCEKPIHDLSMIWNGGQTVDVTAWKGSVGSTSLGTQTAAPGDRITFGDFAGSPNDVVWEIFEAGTSNKLGESKFHLSCSDSEMNGADDCGKAQGDGKGNDSGLINDWVFDGWRDDDETLTCSPEPVCEPGPPGPGPFDCSKPIDALTMVWNGSEAVKIQPWKGNVGSTPLVVVDNIAPGGVPGTASEVTVSGFAGSPNDVIWEIFRAGTSTKLGESKFHLSCSDSEMNGAEDCGSAQGNGKGNDSGLINDWIFEGMVDSDEALDCTP